jgi:hypothetical protein
MVGLILVYWPEKCDLQGRDASYIYSFPIPATRLGHRDTQHSVHGKPWLATGQPQAGAEFHGGSDAPSKHGSGYISRTAAGPLREWELPTYL